MKEKTTGKDYKISICTPKKGVVRGIFLWKVAQGLVQGYHVDFNYSDRRGRLACVSPYKSRSPAQVLKAREALLSVRVCQLFNIIPRGLRELNHGTAEKFKSGLDAWLSTIPDEPSIPDRQRAALTNSLLDQTVLHNANIFQ